MNTLGFFVYIIGLFSLVCVIITLFYVIVFIGNLHDINQGCDNKKNVSEITLANRIIDSSSKVRQSAIIRDYNNCKSYAQTMINWSKPALLSILPWTGGSIITIVLIYMFAYEHLDLKSEFLYKIIYPVIEFFASLLNIFTKNPFIRR